MFDAKGRELKILIVCSQEPTRLELAYNAAKIDAQKPAMAIARKTTASNTEAVHALTGGELHCDRHQLPR